MDHGLLVAGCDLDGRVRLGGGSPADEQRYVEAFALHLFGIVDHLVQRRRYEARESDNVRALLFGGLQDLGGRNHHPQVYDLEVVQHRSTTPTIFLPMSCTSPFTVAIMTVPLGFRASPFLPPQ